MTPRNSANAVRLATPDDVADYITDLDEAIRIAADIIAAFGTCTPVQLFNNHVDPHLIAAHYSTIETGARSMARLEAS